MTIRLDHLNSVYKNITDVLRIPVTTPIIGVKYELSGKIFQWNRASGLWGEVSARLKPMYYCGSYSADYHTPEYLNVARKYNYHVLVFHPDKEVADRVRVLGINHRDTKQYTPGYTVNPNFATARTAFMNAVKENECYMLGKSTKVYK